MNHFPELPSEMSWLRWRIEIAALVFPVNFEPQCRANLGTTSL